VRRDHSASTVIGLLLSGILANNTQADEICPDHLKQVLNNGRYEFEYQSWSWPSKDESKSQLYCHCVRNNKHDEALWVDWKGTGLQTFVLPNSVSYAYMSYTDGIEDKKSSLLWYGARPDKLDTQIVFNKQTAEPQKPAVPAAAKPESKSGYSVSTNPPVLESEARIALPGAQVVWQKGLSLAQIREIVQRQPVLLATMDMTFTSEPELNSKGKWISVKNTCHYAFSDLVPSPFLGGSNQFVYRMRILAPALHREVFGSPAPQGVRPWGHGSSPAFSGTTKIRPSSANNLARSTSVLQVLAPSSDFVLASMPISYYRVDEAKIALNDSHEHHPPTQE
jgi:hypothetical protein